MSITETFIRKITNEAESNASEFNDLAGQLLRAKVKAAVLRQRIDALDALLALYSETSA